LKKIIIFILLISLPIVGVAMSFFTKQVLFSEVKGIVLSQGNPIKGVEVLRRYRYEDDTQEETIKTNQDGSFYFSKAIKKSLFNMDFLPSDVVVSQEIILNYKNISYDAWVFVRGNYDDGSELGVKTINLICDISHEPKQITSKTGGVVYGICQ